MFIFNLALVTILTCLFTAAWTTAIDPGRN